MPVSARSGFIIDRAGAEAALHLIETQGGSALATARAVAETSRRAENVAEFCRWREIARLINILSNNDALTRH